MPTKRQFDLVVMGVILVNIALTLPKMWAYRVASSNSENGIKNDIAGSVILS